MSGKQTYQPEERIKRYLEDQMPEEDRHAFEREMQHDPFLAEAVEGFSGISAGLFSTDLTDLKNRLNKQQKGNRKYIWYAAASVIVLVVSSIILFHPKEISKQIVSENRIQQKAAPVKETVTQKKEIDLREPVSDKKSLPKTNIILTEKDMIVSEREVVAPSKMTQIAEDDTVLSVYEQSKMRDAVQLPGNILVANADKAVSDSSAIAFKEVDTSKNQIRIRGVSSINNQVSIAPGVKIAAQSANGKRDSEKVAITPDVKEDMALNEVVVVGYGTQKKMDITGAVAGVVVTRMTGASAGLKTNQMEDMSASPKTGWVDFNKYLKAALLSPNIGSPKVKTVVRLSFVITQTGLIEQIKVLDSKDERYNEEAIRILKAGPGWNPEVKGQAPQSSVVKLRMVFESAEKKL